MSICLFGVAAGDEQRLVACVAARLWNVYVGNKAIGDQIVPALFEMCQRDTGPSHPAILPLVILRTEGEVLLFPKSAYVIFANLPHRTTELVVSFGLLLVGVLGLERVRLEAEMAVAPRQAARS